jgi:prolipoprotein diacylglyceryltransferase
MDTFSHVASSFWFDNGKLTLDLLQTTTWYSTMYQLAFFIALCIFIYEGIRRKYPVGSWMIITASASFFIVFGSKIGTYSLDDWRLFFQSGVLESTGKKTSLGAALLIFPGLWLIRRIIRFKASIWVAFAFFAPAMMFVQRMGCMLAGCCYGKPTEAITGVRYFGPSVLRDQQIKHEYIPYNQFTTEAVHNVPLYYMVVAAFTIGLLFFLRNRVKNGRQLLIVSASSMLIGRFVIDFFRDVHAHNIQQHLVHGLKPHQWIMMLVLIILVVLFKQFNKKVDNQKPLPVYPRRNLTVLLLLSLATLLLKDWFTNYEKVVLYAQMLVAIVANLKTIWEEERQFKPLVVPLTFVLATAVLIAQNAEDSNKVVPKGKTYFNSTITQNRLHNTTYPCSRIEQGCVGENCVLSDTARPHGPNYNSLQLGIEHEFAPNKKGLYATLGMDLAFERFGNADEAYNPLYFHVSPYVTFRGPILGASLGIRTGQMFSTAPLRPFELQRNSVFYILPRFAYWIGSDNHFFKFHTGFLDDYMPNGIMPSIASTRMSFRISDNDMRMIRAGVVAAGGDVANRQGSTYLGLYSKIHLKNNNTTLMPGFGLTVFEEENMPVRVLPQFSLQLRTEIFR